ncbi:MAG: FecR domain-containing protein [Cyclobacteriaceae bacterium]
MGSKEDRYHQYLNEDKANESEWSAEDREMIEFLEKSRGLKTPAFPQTKDTLWETIENEIVSEDVPSGSSVGSKFSWYAIAAALTVLILSGVAVFSALNHSEEVVFTTGIAENTSVDLPDGSVVYLNSESNLYYDQDWDRSLKLQGEAFFEVTKGSIFTVNTSMGDVKVLGTSFNVAIRENMFAVSCKTGKVEVNFYGAKNSAVVLTKGQTVLFDSYKVITGDIDIDKIASWQIGEFYYASRPLSEVFEDIRRHYNVTIKFAEKDIDARLFNGYFYTENLKTSLSWICDPMGLTYKINGKEVLIESKD